MLLTLAQRVPSAETIATEIENPTPIYIQHVEPDWTKRRADSPTDSQAEIFCFSPPGDPANDDEALAERAAVMAIENGWSEATALREASWAANREKCWRAFLLNAKRILDAPAWRSEALLAQYKVEAISRYGQNTGAVMADELWAWVVARGTGGVQ